MDGTMLAVGKSMGPTTVHIKKPGEMRISKSEIADLDLKILNPHIWAPAGAVGAVGKRLMWPNRRVIVQILAVANSE